MRSGFSIPELAARAARAALAAPAALLISAAGIMVPAAATAGQDARTIPGMIDSAAETFRVSIPAHATMTIGVIATSGLDPIIAVTDAGSGQLLAENDDNGDGVNSRVRVVGGPDGRDIVVKVSSFDAALLAAGERFGGSFDLVLTTAAYTLPDPTQLIINSVLTLTIDYQLNERALSQIRSGDVRR